ncbi:MAG: hypothetical protein KF893_18345 [Caldilineaceae bacterium]|nr:hypothetical protein [Caldilineaceae bacterium]
MTTQGFINIWRGVFVPLILSVVLVMITACQLAITPVAPTETSQPIQTLPTSLLLTVDDLPEAFGVPGIASAPRSQIEDWRWSGAQDHLEQVYQSQDSRVSVRQHVLQFVTIEQAEQFWQEMKNTRIERSLTRYEVTPLLSVEELPPLHADDVSLRCETYPGVRYTNCEVRLRYRFLYTGVNLFVNPPAQLSMESVYPIVAAVDERMRPFWSQ